MKQVKPVKRKEKMARIVNIKFFVLPIQRMWAECVFMDKGRLDLVRIERLELIDIRIGWLRSLTVMDSLKLARSPRFCFSRSLWAANVVSSFSCFFLWRQRLPFRPSISFFVYLAHGELKPETASIDCTKRESRWLVSDAFAIQVTEDWIFFYTTYSHTCTYGAGSD